MCGKRFGGERMNSKELLAEISTKPSDNYATPSWIMSMFEGWYDPCPLNPNPTVDGLKEDWKDKTYVNPPYSNPLPWVLKSIEENKKGKRIALLLKLDCSTRWYRELMNANAHIIFINERVKFSGKPPLFSCFIAILDTADLKYYENKLKHLEEKE
jgi:hypothetical protein